MASISTFPDYCLTCDRQIDSSGEVYCSQQCRLADNLCTSPSSSNTSLPPTPVGHSHPQNAYSSSSARRPTSTSVSSNSSSRSNPRHSGNAFVLPPAYDFSSHRHSTVSNASSSSSMTSMASSQKSASSRSARPPSGYFAYASSSNMLLSSSEAAKKTLSPTSSRSSITSSITGGGEDIRHELRAYESGFDVTRDWRRRRASVYDSAWQRT